MLFFLSCAFRRKKLGHLYIYIYIFVFTYCIFFGLIPSIFGEHLIDGPFYLKTCIKIVTCIYIPNNYRMYSVTAVIAVYAF